MTEPTKLHIAARILAVEMAVIVAGVLIAPAINDWRQNVHNLSLERDYYQQLVSNLPATDKAAHKAEEYNSTPIDNVKALMTIVEDQNEADFTQIVDLLDQS